MLTLRCRKILKTLLSAATPVKIRDLQEEFKVSERTVKYDVELLRDWLGDEMQRKVRLVNRPRAGLVVEGAAEDLERVAALAMDGAGRAVILHPRERVRSIALLLLLTDEFLTLESLSEQLLVSKNTVSVDLAGVTKFFSLRNIELERKAHWGLRIQASEIKRRLAIEYLILTLMDGKDAALLLQNLREGGVPAPLREILCRFLLETKEAGAVYDMFGKLLLWLGSKRAERMDDRAALALLARLCVTVARLRRGAALTEESSESDLPDSIVPAAEGLRSLFASLGLAAGMRDLKFMILPFAERGDAALDLTAVVTRIIRHVGRLAQVTFESDGDLFENLLSHLRERLVRHRYGAVDPNPLLESVRHYYADLFRTVRQVAHDVLGSYDVLLPDEDIAYLTLHFQASYERRCGKQKFRALVVCGTGRGSAKLLKARLENACGDLHVTGCCPLLELEEALRWQAVDIIVSVLPLQTELPHVVVNALLGERDIEAVRAKLGELGERSGGTESLADEWSKSLSPEGETKPQMELLSQEIISKGFQIGLSIGEAFRPYLNRESEMGLILHCMLMANRLAFHSPYVDFGGARWGDTPLRRRIAGQVKELTHHCYPAVPDSEIYAILNYFAIEEDEKDA